MAQIHAEASAWVWTRQSLNCHRLESLNLCLIDSCCTTAESCQRSARTVRCANTVLVPNDVVMKQRRASLEITKKGARGASVPVRPTQANKVIFKFDSECMAPVIKRFSTLSLQKCTYRQSVTTTYRKSWYAIGLQLCNGKRFKQNHVCWLLRGIKLVTQLVERDL